jgi:hypothetical protein
MDIILLENLKKSISPSSWLSLLDDNQLIKIFDMLKRGTTNSEVIRTCQSIFNIRQKATLSDLLPDLVKFRMQVLDDRSLLKLEEAQKNQVAVELAGKLRGLTSKVDAFGRLNWLADLQTQRVIRLMERETKTLPMDITTDNIKALQDMLLKILKAKQELKLDEGVSQITPDTTEKIKGLVEGFKDDGETMIQATHKLLELAEERSLILKLDSDGKYAISSKNEDKEEEVVG